MGDWVLPDAPFWLALTIVIGIIYVPVGVLILTLEHRRSKHEQ